MIVIPEIPRKLRPSIYFLVDHRVTCACAPECPAPLSTLCCCVYLPCGQESWVEQREPRADPHLCSALQTPISVVLCKPPISVVFCKPPISIVLCKPPISVVLCKPPAFYAVTRGYWVFFSICVGSWRWNAVPILFLPAYLKVKAYLIVSSEVSQKLQVSILKINLDLKILEENKIDWALKVPCAL